MNTFQRSLAIVTVVGLCGVGCSGNKPEERNVNSTDELFEQYFGKSLERFNNRTIYTELNGEVIKTIPDEDLEQAIRDFIGLKIDHDWKNDVKRVPALGPGFSAVYFLSVLETEVNNGGFNQLFHNQGREAVVQARQGADLLGLSALSSLIARALEKEEVEREKMAKVKEAGTLEAFFASYGDLSFASLDDEFLSLEDSLEEARIAFIRTHSELFEGRQEK